MDPEKVQAALAAKRDVGSVVRRLSGVKQIASLLSGRGLPKSVRSLVTDAFAAPEYGRSMVFAHKRGEIGEQFKDYAPADWNRLISTLLPRIARSAESAISALARRPFQDGLSRRPFRCPQSPATLADVRGRWLLNTTLIVGEYDADIRWVAEHAVHLTGWWGSVELGWLLAGAMDAGDDASDAVFNTLDATVRGETESATMGRHVTQALMSSGRADAWELVERLLLSAQRQEGLRQVILESVDEAHPQAFRRMLRLILDHDLTRFSSVVRAADTWFGFAWDGASAVKAESLIERVLRFLDDPEARTAALHDTDAETVYLALWSTAFDDVDAAMPPAISLLGAPTPEVRFVATHFLVQSLWSGALPALVGAISDADLRVASRALDMFGTDQTAHVDGERLFTQLEGLLGRLTKRSQALDAIVWPWWKRRLERAHVASALAVNARKVSPERLIPYVPDLDPTARAMFLRRAAGIRSRWEANTNTSERRPLSLAERGVAIDLLGDVSEDVRNAAFEAMRELPVLLDERDRLVDLLGRKPGDLRNGALARLRTLDDARFLEAVDRLLGDDSDLRRVAGLELLRDANEGHRLEADVRGRMQRYASEHPSLSEAERAHVDAVLGDTNIPATRDDALGLLGGITLREWPAPTARHIAVDTPGSAASLTALAALVLQHQATEVRTPSGETQLLVESAGWNWGPRRREQLEAESTIPLAVTWRSWLRDRPDAQRDEDGLEILRALQATEESKTWKQGIVRQVCGLGQYSAGTRFLRGLCEWCVAWEPPATGFAFLLEGLEGALAQLTESDFRELQANGGPKRIFNGPEGTPVSEEKVQRAAHWLRRLRWWRGLFPDSISPAHAEQLYALLRAFEERSQGFSMLTITPEDFLAAYRADAVGEAELIHLLVGRWSYRTEGTLLRDVSQRRAPRALYEHPALLAVVDRCRRRIVEVEVQRGDRQTAASGLAMELRSTGGLDTIARALPALGKSHFTRSFGWSPSGASRQDTLSHLVLRTMPRDEDTLDAFARWAREAKTPESRLIELAVYAPQWAAHVNHVIQWPGLEGGVWWIQAHTKDDRSWQLQELKEIWAAEVSERTPLSAIDLTEGAVDVEWFTRVYGELGAARWKALDTAAKYAASSAGHTRAQLFARAMGGVVTRQELLERIDASRHQDSVRALGLLPLAQGEERQRDLLERFHRLEAFKRESRKFGSQRQQSESRAVAIGLANLARTAGYRDPQRLQWAMEQQAVADLARGPLVLDRGDVRITLSVSIDGEPSLTFARQGKSLKALPASLKKDSEVSELTSRLQGLRRQRSRVRSALEEAMCRGDRFEPEELRSLLDHPILAPVIGKIVFIGDGVAGYLAEGGRMLRDHADAQHVLGHAEEVRIAHPNDLFARGDWSEWQRECFAAERVQPFKQLFREFYPLTASERGTEKTRRYAGHQVNPRQALALLGGRGWVAHPEEGVSRTFHEYGMTARLAFQQAFYTPADVEGLTLEEVLFTRKGEWTALSLDVIPARLFSEAMRDLDLVVSVAHQGGVDPEASASTVEMRATLLQETCGLLGLMNVEVSGSHARIRGKLAEYSIHLGSAGAMVLPGTALPIVAVHSQHRGRLFLPFADDDPRTAEVLSKVLLLARDGEIRDPNILEWIRAARGGGRS